jgi:tetratricopeptide (TPR) repeat protein
MKKVFTLFCLTFTIATLSASAQMGLNADSASRKATGIVDSVKTDSLAAKVVAVPDEFPRQAYLANIYKTNQSIFKRPAAPKADTTKIVYASVSDTDLQVSLGQKIALNLNDLQDQFTAIAKDSLQARIPQKMPANITALKQQINLVTNDTVRAGYYQKIANYYMNYDSISIRKTKALYQDDALEFTMKALHSYSKCNDGYGIMACYNNLSKVYRDQKKFPQAKWFILQANTLARNIGDAPMIVSTLVTLAEIKMDIKDYKLAQRDLDEALSLTAQNRYPKQESLVQTSYYRLYNHMNDPKKAAGALKRHDFIEDSNTKAADARKLAMVKTQDSTAKVQDSTQQAKKKLYTLVGKKLSKTNSPKKTVSL